MSAPDAAENPPEAVGIAAAPATDADAWRQPRVLLRLVILFLGMPLMIGCLLTRLPEIREALEVEYAELALALIGASIGTLVMLPVAGRLLSALGIRRALLVGMPLYLVSMALAPHAGSVIALFIILLAVGGAIAFTELGLNLGATYFEQQSGRLVMSRLHGCWSIGLMCGSLLGVAFAWLGLGLAVSTAIVAAISVGPLIYSSQTMPRLGARVETDEDGSGGGRHPRFPLVLIAIALFSMPLTMVEGAVGDWSAIMLRDVFGAGPAVAGIGFALFAALHAAGRLGGDWCKARLGVLPLARLLGVTCLAGNLLVVFSPHAGVAILGFALFGLGASAGYPLAMSAAGALPGRTPRHLATLTFFGIGAFLVGPPLIGFVADQAGLRAGYAVMLPLLAMSLLMSGGLRPRAG